MMICSARAALPPNDCPLAEPDVLDRLRQCPPSRPYRKLHPRWALSHSLSRVDFAAILSLGADALIFRHAGCDGPSSLTNKMREYDIKCANMTKPLNWILSSPQPIRECMAGTDGLAFLGHAPLGGIKS